jgi:hypothetical protein
MGDAPRRGLRRRSAAGHDLRRFVRRHVGEHADGLPAGEGPLSSRHRAIAQSGIGGFGPFRRLDTNVDERDPPSALGAADAAKLGLDRSSDIAAALRAVPWKTVADLGDGDSGVEPVVDGDLIPDDPARRRSSPASPA